MNREDVIHLAQLQVSLERVAEELDKWATTSNQELTGVDLEATAESLHEAALKLDYLVHKGE